jgi:hypothetical protein
MNTPWGIADSHEHVAEGIDFYGTPSHGGYKLSAERNKIVPTALKERSFCRQGLEGWYEEDCDYNIVVVTFPQFFMPEQVCCAIEFVADHYTSLDTNGTEFYLMTGALGIVTPDGSLSYANDPPALLLDDQEVAENMARKLVKKWAHRLGWIGVYNNKTHERIFCVDKWGDEGRP